MNLSDIFYSPSLRPFMARTWPDGSPKKIFPAAAYIRYRESRLHEIRECVYIAHSRRELTARVRELHRVQSSMGLQINVPFEKAEKSGAFLSYSPISGPFRVLTDSVILESTGERIPLKKTRWIAHEKKKFEF
ncbi:MAG TPA: hypothetical protein P5295_03490 [Spirochaetota bacterium]|nr:hypothetical protein [Spirochaetota bacterium]